MSKACYIPVTIDQLRFMTGDSFSIVLSYDGIDIVLYADRALGTFDAYGNTDWLKMTMFGLFNLRVETVNDELCFIIETLNDNDTEHQVGISLIPNLDNFELNSMTRKTLRVEDLPILYLNNEPRTLISLLNEICTVIPDAPKMTISPEHVYNDISSGGGDDY